MNLKDILELTNFIAGRKAPGVRGLTLQNFNRLIKTANLANLKRKIGLPEEYQPGYPASRQSYNLTQINTEDLRPFKVMMDGNEFPPLRFTNGLATLPSDYFYISSLAIGYGVGSNKRWKKATIVTDDTWDKMTGSYVNYPNQEYPIARFTATKLQISPSATTGKLVYLRKPLDPVYATKIVGDVMGYDEANSVQLEWNDINQMDIMVILLSYMGVAIERQDVTQFAEMKKTQGV